MRGSAIISECGRYRYRLTRRTGEAGLIVVFVMLNPSTADAFQDDPTIRRCLSFARAAAERRDEVLEAVEVLNVFPWRATDPRDLALARKRGHDIISRTDRDRAFGAIPNHALWIVAWGAHPLAALEAPRIAHILTNPHALGITNGGAPRHPLYLPKAAEPFPFPASTWYRK